MYEDSSMPTKILGISVKKRDNKVRTFAPKDSKIDSSLKDFEIDSFLKDSKINSSLKDFEIDSFLKDSKINSSLKDFEIDSFLKDSKINSSLKDFEINSLPKFNEKSNRLKNLSEEYQNITEEKNIPNLNKITNTEDNFISPAKLEKINPNYIVKIMKNDKFYEDELNISDARMKYFDKMIKENPEMSTKKINIINKLRELYIARKEYFEKIYINKKNKIKRKNYSYWMMKYAN